MELDGFSIKLVGFGQELTKMIDIIGLTSQALSARSYVQ